MSYKETICTPAGTECYKSINEEKDKCLNPCKGVFADVKKNRNIKKIEEAEDFRNILDSYKEYKNGYSQGYSEDVGGMLMYIIFIEELFNFFKDLKKRPNSTGLRYILQLQPSTL